VKRLKAERGLGTAKDSSPVLDSHTGPPCHHPRALYLKDRGMAARSSTSPCLTAGVLSVTKSTTSAAAKHRR